MAALKLPCRTLIFYAAGLLFPARFEAGFTSTLVDKEKVYMSFNMGGDCAPSLFVTVDCFERHPEEFGKLFLSLFKFFSCKTEFFFGQGDTSFVICNAI